MTKKFTIENKIKDTIMNKTDLINAFAETASLQKKQAAELFDTLMNVITDTLARHEEIKLMGFGTFKIADVQPKTVTNPQNRQKMDIKGYTRVRFVPSQALKEKLNKK
jgi:nucleoid DNA-binding protein